MFKFLDNFKEKKSCHSKFQTWFSKNWQELLAEFWSTLTHVVLECLTAKPLTQLPAYESINLGMVVMFNIQAFGHISGAYMNPAITLSAVMFGRMSPILGLGHLVAQCSGAIAGYASLLAIISLDLAEDVVCLTTTEDEQNDYQALGIQIITTFCLVLVMCSFWDPVNANLHETIPLKFGLAMMGLTLMGGPYTGGIINPASALGPALWANMWTQHWVYWVGPLIGSLSGTSLYILLSLNKPPYD